MSTLGLSLSRDDETVKQSKESFVLELYKPSIIKDFVPIILLQKNSLVNFKNYLRFCKRNKLPFEVVKNKNFFMKINEKNNNIEGIIKVKEPIYSWKIIKEIIYKKIKNKKVFTNSEVKKIIKKKNIFYVKTNKKTFNADIVIDASYLF